MLKQSFSRITKVLTVLLAVLFVATMTVGAASACNSEHSYEHGLTVTMVTMAVTVIMRTMDAR